MGGRVLGVGIGGVDRDESVYRKEMITSFRVLFSFHGPYVFVGILNPRPHTAKMLHSAWPRV